MIRSTVARVDLAALKSNFAAIRSYVSSEGGRTPPAIIGVVKANAYGHGAPRVALALQEAGATMLACADIEEGIVLRQAGVRVPILVFGALSVSDLDGLFDFSLTPTISTPGAARAVQAAAMRRSTTIAYHLKIDTGMNRLGFRHDNLRRTLPELLASSNLRLDAVYTHFASADVAESPVFGTQRERFDVAWSVVEELCRESRSRIPNPESRTPNPESRTPNPESRIPTPNPESRIPSVPSRMQQRRVASRFARLVRRGAPRAAAVWDRAAALGVNHRSHPGDVAYESRRRSQRIETG